MLIVLSFNLHASEESDVMSTLQKEITPAEIKQDLDFWLEWLDKTHPDLNYTIADLKGFKAKVNALGSSYKESTTVKQFLYDVMALNEILSDGHMSISLGKATKYIEHIDAQGKGLFPFTVAFQNEELVINKKLGGQATDLSGYVINAVNGVPVSDILEQLLVRSSGDSVRHRKAALEKRFNYYYWLLIEQADEFILNVKKGRESKNVIVAASKSNGEFDKIFEKYFHLAFPAKNTALLTINSFNWGKEYKKYYAFMEESFKAINERGVEHLIIDIRNNGGGDDSYWMKGIYAYIADKPYKTGSNYKLKVVEGRAFDDHKVGDVVDGVMTTIREDSLNNPNRFKGKTSILIGPYSYSSSILFANVAQDYGLATLVGTKTGGRAAQTGGIQRTSLPNSKFSVTSPRFWMERPKGGNPQTPVSPDVEIETSPLNAMELVEKLIKLFRG